VGVVFVLLGDGLAGTARANPRAALGAIHVLLTCHERAGFASQLRRLFRDGARLDERLTDEEHLVARRGAELTGVTRAAAAARSAACWSATAAVGAARGRAARGRSSARRRGAPRGRD